MASSSAVAERRGILVTFASLEEQRPVFEEVLRGEDLSYLGDVAEDGRVDAVRSSRAVIGWNLRRELTPDQLAALDGVGLVQLLSAGADGIPFDLLPDGVPVASNVGAYAEPMAEHTLAMVLALAKRLPQKHAELARGEFQQFPPTKTLDRAVCAVLGFGGIGTACARLLRPFGARIWAVNTSGKTDEDVEWCGTVADLEHVARSADVVVISLPLTKETRGLIGEAELSLMKPDAILVNVARGAIVDQRALFEHLKAKPTFMAGIDAWWVEPWGSGRFELEFPFFDLPNVLGSPHNSAIVPGILAVAAGRAAENVARFLRGGQVRGLVRREDYVDVG
jgi:phosphoglycerate dehydrogenase-like enzyme